MTFWTGVRTLSPLPSGPSIDINGVKRDLDKMHGCIPYTLKIPSRFFD